MVPDCVVTVASQYEEILAAMSNWMFQLLIAIEPLFVTEKSP